MSAIFVAYIITGDINDFVQNETFSWGMLESIKGRPHF